MSEKEAGTTIDEGANAGQTADLDAGTAGETTETAGAAIIGAGLPNSDLPAIGKYDGLNVEYAQGTGALPNSEEETPSFAETEIQRLEDFIAGTCPDEMTSEESPVEVAIRLVGELIQLQAYLMELNAKAEELAAATATTPKGINPHIEGTNAHGEKITSVRED